MKMSGWEKQFSQRIAEIRQKEVAQIQKSNILKALNEAVYFVSNIIMGVMIFLTHVWVGGVLSPRTVFTTMTIINIVQKIMTKFFPYSIMVSTCSI